MIVTIHQPGYLPWLPFLEKTLKSDVFVLLDDVQFEKNSEQNRNRIKTAQGACWLTVPVVRQLRTLIPDVLIPEDDHRWAKKHRAAIDQNYRKAPAFGDVAPELFTLLSNKWEKLLDLNIAIDELFLRVVGHQGELVRASELAVEGRKSDRVVAICQKLGASVYLSGAAGGRYLDLQSFAASGIEVRVQEYRHLPYPQLFPELGFVGRLSALDLFMNVGPGQPSRETILRGGHWACAAESR